MSKHHIPEAALAQHIAILGKTGAGKTSTAKLAIEQVVADGARVCVLDPIKSDWWGLISSADGRRAGLPFHILGGPRGHVPLHDAAGKAIAEVDAPDKGQVGFMAGYRVGKNVGGTFGNVLGQLRSAGLIDYPGPGSAALTGAGRQVANPPSESPSAELLQRAVHARLDGPESRVLSVLIDAYPEPMTKQECGARSGYTVGDNVGDTFGNILGRLRSLGLIDYPATGRVVALPVLFLEGPR